MNLEEGHGLPPPPPPPLILGRIKKEEITEGRKPGRASKPKPPPPTPAHSPPPPPRYATENTVPTFRRPDDATI